MASAGPVTRLSSSGAWWRWTVRTDGLCGPSRSLLASCRPLLRAFFASSVAPTSLAGHRELDADAAAAGARDGAGDDVADGVGQGHGLAAHGGAEVPEAGLLGGGVAARHGAGHREDDVLEVDLLGRAVEHGHDVAGDLAVHGLPGHAAGGVAGGGALAQAQRGRGGQTEV